jgi:hypothetical protein
MTSMLPGEAHKGAVDMLKGKAPGYVKPARTVVIGYPVARTPAGSPDVAWVRGQIERDAQTRCDGQALDAVALQVQATFADVLGMSPIQVRVSLVPPGREERRGLVALQKQSSAMCIA